MIFKPKVGLYIAVIILGLEMLVIFNVNTGTTLPLKTIINQLKSN